MPASTLRSVFARLSLGPSVSSPMTQISSGRSIIIPAISFTPAFSSSLSIPSCVQSQSQSQSQFRSFHASAAGQAKKVAASAKGGKGQKNSKKRKQGANGPDPRIRNLKMSMSRAVPAPLRFARNRALRHWTIHRAWMLYQRKERERQTHELERMYQSMNSACEELRNTSGPGTRPEGYLYRVAMEKHGLYGHNGIPIEYARMQSETPARQAWNHEWTR